MLGDDALVLHRQLPAGERHHACAERDVPVMQGCQLQRSRHAPSMLTSLRKASLRLNLLELQPERRTGSWGQPGWVNPKRATLSYRGPGGRKPPLLVPEKGGNLQLLRGIGPRRAGAGPLDRRNRRLEDLAPTAPSSRAAAPEAGRDHGHANPFVDRVVDH